MPVSTWPAWSSRRYFKPAAAYATLGEMLQGEADEVKKGKITKQSQQGSFGINRYAFGSVQ